MQNQINPALLEQAIAARALSQMSRISVFPKVCVTGYENGTFQRSEEVTVRRPKKRRAQDLNPRVAAATFDEGEFFSTKVKLERLWTDGFQVYGSDPSQSLQLYINETAQQTADAIIEPNDEYMYSRFRTWDIPTTGLVELGGTAPIAITAAVNGADISAMNNTALRNAETLLDKFNVPSSDRFCVLSAGAKGDFIGDGLIVSNNNANIPSNLVINQEQFVRQGLPLATFTPRYNFLVAGSNSVQGQNGVFDLDTNGSASLVLSAVALNPMFTYGDYKETKLAGAIDFTLTVTGSLANVAIGQIARIGTASGVKAFGVVLRVAANVVTLVPYSPEGRVLTIDAFSTGTDELSIPNIGSVNTVNHREALLCATRRIKEPSQGSGAKGSSMTDRETGLTIQIFTGQYDLSRVREINAAYMLTGSKMSDTRKAGLILSL
jgi:hypothetical protein